MASNYIYSPYNQQPPPGSGQPMNFPAEGNSYASRSAQAYVNSAPPGAPPPVPSMPVDQYNQQAPPPQPPPQPPTQSYQQPQYYTPAPPSTQQPQNITEPTSNPQYGRIPSPYHNPNPVRPDTKSIQSEQNLLETSIRRMQEAAHIMRGAMDADDLSTTLDRAAAMLGELGDPKNHQHHHHHHHHHNQHGHAHSHSSKPIAVMTPKHYYEMHMLAMEELPNIEEYFLSLSSGPTPQYSMKDLYEITQYTSRAVPRLYLQICAGSALIRSGEEDVTNVLNDLIQAVKCVQCPIRGLFLRDYLLKAVRDKLPDEAEAGAQPVVESAFEEAPADGAGDPNSKLSSLMGDLTMNTQESAFLDATSGNMSTENAATQNQIARPRCDSFDNSSGQVKDSYQFVLANFIEMNKLWVRIQHLPGDAKNKETKRRRERERNELRMMVGTNLVRLSELEGVTSSIYGTVILPRILDQIVACRDPLAQAYLMDCIIQVFPDEFHIQTLEVVLGVCPKLRDKVNIRTILQSIMDRLSNYYSDELLLNDEEDTEGVKTSVMLDSFEMFDECIRAVLEGRGAKINAKEVIRLESSLLDFSLKCYPGRMDHINRCLGACAACLRGEGTSIGAIATEVGNSKPIPMNDVAVKELENLLSLPLETMGLNILDLDQYSELLQFLPLEHRKRVALELLNVLYQSGEKMSELSEVEQLFSIVSPLIWNDRKPLNETKASEEKESISKLIHLLYNEDTDIHFEILNFVKKYLFSSGSGVKACSYTVSPLYFSSMKLLWRVKNLEFPTPLDTKQDDEIETGEMNLEDLERSGIDDENDIVKEEKVPESTEVDNEKVDSVDAASAREEDDTGTIQENDQAESSEDESGESSKDEISIENGENDPEEIVSGRETNELNDDNEDVVKEDVVKEDVVKEDVVKEDVDQQSQSNQGDEDEKSNEFQENQDLEKDETDISYQDLEKDETDISYQNGDTEQCDSAQHDDNAAPTRSDSLSAIAEPKQQIQELFPFDDGVPAHTVFNKSTNCRKVFLFIQKLLSFVEMTSAELCFDLRLQAAVAADKCAVLSAETGNGTDLDTIAYEFVTEAFLTYEAEINESSAQKKAMMKIIGVLLSCDSFQKNDYETLITKATQNSARLLKKTDQCSMVLMCSHLFFKDENVYQNPQRVLECLQRALKLADICTTASPANLSLFVDIFDKYVYYFEKGNPFVTDKFISGLIALINEHINSIGVSNHVIGEAKGHFIQSVKYIEDKKYDAVSGERFGAIICILP